MLLFNLVQVMYFICTTQSIQLNLQLPPLSEGPWVGFATPPLSIGPWVGLATPPLSEGPWVGFATPPII